jgi:antitoxin (DNA-binding transcriptional repressor) of toxin-antitoxin stability system
MQISLSELKTGPEKYIALVDKQDIYITENGKRVAKLTGTKTDKVEAAKALFGILPDSVDLDTARLERFGN